MLNKISLRWSQHYATFRPPSWGRPLTTKPQQHNTIPPATDTSEPVNHAGDRPPPPRTTSTSIKGSLDYRFGLHMPLPMQSELINERTFSEPSEAAREVGRTAPEDPRGGPKARQFRDHERG
jgi:hypothetical protein